MSCMNIVRLKRSRAEVGLYRYAIGVIAVLQMTNVVVFLHATNMIVFLHVAGVVLDEY